MHDAIRSQIANKISKKMFRIYIAIYFVILFLLLLFLIPFLYRSTLKQSDQTLDSMATEYELLQKNMEESLNRFYLSTELSDYLKQYDDEPSVPTEKKISLTLGKVAPIISRMYAACLETPDGKFFTSTNQSQVDKKELLHQYSGYTRLLEQEHGNFFSPVIRNMFHNEYLTYHDTFAYSQNIQINSHTYVATVFYDSFYSFRQLQTLYSASFSEYTILNHYHDVLYETTDFFDQPIISDRLKQTKNTSGHFKYQNGLIFYQVIPSTASFIAAYIPYSDLFKELFLIIGILTLLYTLSPVLYGFFLRPITRQQLAPLKQLSDTMNNYKAGDNIQVNFHTNDEIQTIGDSFNSMVKDIRKRIEDIKLQEHQNAVINYKLLATQVDPHFIYNTMNVINIMAQDGRADEVVEINTALIKILRERLNSKISIFETVQTEIDTLMQYCCIINHRHHNHISVHFDIDDTLMQKWIPKNILQPLVENSFYHAFSDFTKDIQGNINIMIYSIEKEMTIEVSDDGSGMDNSRIEKIMEDTPDIYKDKKPHIGINNIRQRLAFLYPENHEFLIQSSPGHGTTIIITIPETDTQPNFSGTL